MLRQTAKHIFALADVDKVVVDADAVDAWVFVFLRESFAFQPCVDAIFVSHHQNTNPVFSGLGGKCQEEFAVCNTMNLQLKVPGSRRRVTGVSP